MSFFARIFKRKYEDRPNERRTVSWGDPEVGKRYSDNTVVSTKYNPITFIPMNLYEQFHRPINLYFLAVAVLQFVPSIAPVSPYTTIFPISVAFFTNTVKEGVDDWRRHRQDAENNSRICHIVNPTTLEVVEVKSKDLRVGDIVVLSPFESVPSDVLVLLTSGEAGEVLISTQSLDGETETKRRLALLRRLYKPRADTWPARRGGSVDWSGGGSSYWSETLSPSPLLPTLSTMDSWGPGRGDLTDAVRFLSRAQFSLDSEGPNSFLHAYSGTATCALPGDGEVDGVFAEERVTLPVAYENVILASSQMQNTLCTLALVVFTGMNTKVNMTRTIPAIKWAAIDRKFNILSIGIFCLQLVLVVVYAVLSGLHLARNRFWYLGGSERRVRMSEYFPVLPLRYFTMLSPMVPLSFKVMVELSKVYVSCVIGWDDDLKDDKGRPASVNNSALAEDLGQVQYIFSDKTGTLTNNVMSFHSIATANGEVYRDRCDDPDALRVLQLQSQVNVGIRYLLMSMTFCNTIERSLSATTTAATSSAPITSSVHVPHSASGEIPHVHSRTQSASWYHPQPGRWMSCSPDEVALVHGAARCRMVLTERFKDSATATVPGEGFLRVSILKTLYFSSERGRMSVLLRLPSRRGGSDGEVVVLLTKGSDEKVLPLCVDAGGASTATSGACRRAKTEYVNLDHDSKEDFLAYRSPSSSQTPQSGQAPRVWQRDVESQLTCFSSQGLRTLVYAYRVVPETEAREWLERVNEQEGAATSSPTSAAEQRAQLWELYAEMEQDMVYCGCTAVQDDLQKDARLTISTLRQANIRVWMLTGDRTETARQTAVASGLLTPEDRVVALVPPQACSRAGLLHYAAERIRDFSGERWAEERRGGRARWWRVLYEKSGMSDIVSEFRAQDTSANFKKIVQSLGRVEERHVHGGLDGGGIGEDANDGCDYGPHATAWGATRPEARGLPATATTTTAAAAVTHSEDARTIGDGSYSVTLSGLTIEVVCGSGDEQLLRDFRTVLLHASTVVCSRTDPGQKALVVKMIKDVGKITLAIGDGGNDVAMIQTAHVGVGIKGNEGNQAARAADFSIAQFRFLAKLLLVHGHTAYHRTAMIAQQSFWKTVLIAWAQVLFNNSTDYSGVSYWDSLSLMLYNAIPTVPVTFLCVMDMPLSPWQLLRHPHLYSMSQRGRYLSAVTFYGYIARAFLHGTFAYYLAMWLLEGSGGVLRRGYVVDRYCDFYAAYFAVVTVHTYTVMTESHSITFVHWQCFYFSVWSCFLCFGLAARVPGANQSFGRMLVNPHFYLLYVGLTTFISLSLAIYVIIKYFWFQDLLQFHRLLMKTVHSRWDIYAPFRLLFHDDNPSDFWGSQSPLHAVQMVRGSQYHSVSSTELPRT